MDEDVQPLHGDRRREQERVEGQIAALSARVAQLEGFVVAMQAGGAQPLEAAASAPASTPPPPLAGGAGLGQAAGAVREPLARRRPDLENRLGSQVFNRVGIVALLVGGAWGLKLAADEGWVGPAGRVVIGLLVGAGLVLWSERFRAKGYAAFSYSLKALGSGLLYLTLWAAFQLYALVPAWVALLAMVLVTAWNAYLAWRQDAELLALYALIGGFATPALLSTGRDHALFLFIYLLAIDLATALLVLSKGWSRLLVVALPSTVSLFVAWYATHYSAQQVVETVLYLVATAAVFALPSVLRARPAATVPEGAPSLRWRLVPRVLLPMANAALLGFGLYAALVDASQRGILPWSMLAVAAVYLALMRLPQAAVTRAVHLSLAVTFLSVAIPLKLHGSWMTVAWLAEGLALVWVATVRTAAAAADDQNDDTVPVEQLALRWLAAASLLLGWLAAVARVEASDARIAFLNQRFATALVGLAVFALAGMLAWRARGAADTGGPEATRAGERLGFREIAAGCLIAFNVLAVLAGVREIQAFWRSTVPGSPMELQQALAISGFLMVYGAVLLLLGFARRSAFVRWQGLLLLVFSILKTFVYDMRNLSQGYRVASFVALGALLMGVSFAYQKDWLALREHGTTEPAGNADHAERLR